MRILDFADGFTSTSEPTQGLLTASGVGCYADEATFLAFLGRAAACGDAYYDQALSRFRMHDGSVWQNFLLAANNETITGDWTYEGDILFGNTGARLDTVGLHNLFLGTTNAANVIVGVAGRTTNVKGSLTVDEDLTVSGTTTTINTTTLDVEDANITVNNGGNDASAEGSGLTVERTGVDGSIVYADAAASKFKIGAAGSEVEVADVSSAQTLSNKTLSGATIDADTNTITNIDNADIKAGAAIDRSKIANGTASYVVYNGIGGALAEEPQLDETRGGTGIGSYAAGDILYASGANTLAKLAKATDGDLLELSGGFPSWVTRRKIAVQDESGPNITSDLDGLDFVGAGVTATAVGDTVTVTVPGVETKDEGISKTTGTASLNFVGTGVTATNVGADVTVTVPGLEVQDGGAPLTTNATKINFAGSGVTTTEPVTDEMLVTIPGLESRDEGLTLISATASIDFVGTGVTATNVGGDVSVSIPGLEVQDEAVSLTTNAKKINFAGAGVVATEPVADEILVTIAGGGGGGGGGGTVDWKQPQTSSLVSAAEGVADIYVETWDFTFEHDSYLVANIPVPSTYSAGNQITLKGGAFKPGANTKVFMKAQSRLIRIGTDTSLPNVHNSTNTEVTPGGDIYTGTGDLDLTDGAGLINAVAVSAGDIISVVLYRDVSAESVPGTADVQVLKHTFQPDFG